jgi:ribosomal protein L35AE/L33A
MAASSPRQASPHCDRLQDHVAPGAVCGPADRNPEGRNNFLRAGVRPATALICDFIDEHKDRFGVVPICRALAVHCVQIAPRTYWAHLSAAPSKRALGDNTITEVLAGVYEPDEHGKRQPECLYGSLQIWAHLQRQGIPVARCTVERIMRVHGWRGAVRARTVRTTERDPPHHRAPDLVRQGHQLSGDTIHRSDDGL